MAPAVSCSARPPRRGLRHKGLYALNGLHALHQRVLLGYYFLKLLINLMLLGSFLSIQSAATILPQVNDSLASAPALSPRAPSFTCEHADRRRLHHCFTNAVLELVLLRKAQMMDGFGIKVPSGCGDGTVNLEGVFNNNGELDEDSRREFVGGRRPS